jgi:ligand-binding sensor domain-containing protein
MRLGPVLILTLFYSSLHGQQLLFENYSSEQGLSQNSCYTIAQDAEGFMWFGTQDGLNRYDGKEFRIFLPQNADGHKLPSNYISSLYFDSLQNQLWVGTIQGACIYKPSRDSLVRITEIYPWAKQLETVSVKRIISFRPQEYWILTFNKGLLCVNISTKTINSYFDDDANRLRVNSITRYRGTIIAAASQQLYAIEPVGGNYEVHALPLSNPLPEVRELFSFQNKLWIGTLTEGCLYAEGPLENLVVHPFKTPGSGIGCFAADARGNLWIGSRGNGLFVHDPRTDSTRFAAHDKYDNRSLGKNFVLSLFSDRQGIIWCGLSGSGLAKFDPLKYQFRTISNEPINDASLPDNMVFDIYRCKDGSYFTGTQNKGLAQWDPATDRFYTYPQSSRFGAISNTIYDMTADDKNNLWVASWGGLMQLDRNSKQLYFNTENNLATAKKLYAIIKLAGADSLFITGENGPVFFSLKDKKWQSCSDNFMQANAVVGRYIYEDNDHILWICTVGAGLVKYDYRRNVFATIEPVKKYSVYVRHLLQDGNLFWLATDNGVVVYDPQKEVVIKHIKLNKPNASNVCYAILKDKQNYFWVSTNTGMYRIDAKSYRIRNYDLDNGLSFLEYNTACALAEEDGTLIFGGTGGITRFNPLQLKENSFSPAPLITSIFVNDKAWQTGPAPFRNQKISLSHNENFVTIHFAVNNFSNQNKNKFAYRLRGLNNNWTDAANRGFANYTSLPPGEYTFELRSANSDDKWSEEVTSLVILISPPWWQTLWFRLGLILAIAGLVTIMVRRRIKAIRHEAGLKQQIAETEMMALRAQMNPHFIFNCINSIDALIQSNDKYHATVYLNKFARLIRNILDSSKQNLVTLSKDLETLQLYIDLEQFRTENKFNARIEAESSLLDENYKVPPLIIQPFVENAILHGLRKKPGNDGLLRIEVKHIDDHIRYIIEDNGAGRQPATTNGHARQKNSYGVQMSRDRVKLFNQEEKASVTITDLYDDNQQPAGTKVQVLLKLQS